MGTGMTWGQSWGSAWGASFGDSFAEKVIITGAGSLEQLAPEVSGSGLCFLASVPEVVVPPDRFPGGGVPSTKFLDDFAARNGLILVGSGEVEHPAGEVIGSARVKLVSLVATSASVDAAPGQVSATAEFRDVELEMVAMLLAA